MIFSRKRSLQLNARLVRDQDAPEIDPIEAVKIAAAYADIAKDLITHAALTIGGVYCICKIVERICK